MPAWVDCSHSQLRQDYTSPEEEHKLLPHHLSLAQTEPSVQRMTLSNNKNRNSTVGFGQPIKYMHTDEQ